MADENALDTAERIETLNLKTQALTSSANGFARAMTQASSSSITSGKQFDDVLNRWR